MPLPHTRWYRSRMRLTKHTIQERHGRWTVSSRGWAIYIPLLIVDAVCLAITLFLLPKSGIDAVAETNMMLGRLEQC